MNRDLNKNGIIDVLEQQIQHASTSTISNFATVAKKSSEIQDGANKCYFNNVNNCLVIKHGNKPLTSCLQLGSKHNTINNVESIKFQDNSSLSGVINNVSTELTEDEKRTTVPSINYIDSVFNPSMDVIAANLMEINGKLHDISYDEEEEETNIAHDLSVSGEIKCDWLNDEFAKYALVGHDHNLDYAPLSHQHEFADIYKNITVQGQNGQTTTTTKTLQQVLTEYEQTLTTAINTKANASHQHEFADIYRQRTIKVLNENTGEEEDVVETKTLQEVFTEYQQNLTTAINEKADLGHYHEMGDIYKRITVQGQDGQTTTTTKTLDAYIIERENDIKALINGKANSSHSHNATDIIYKTADGNNAAVNVKQALDTINQQIDIYDDQGHKVDILSVLFGVGAGVGGLIDGGLVAAVGTLQNEVAVLQGEIATLGAEGLTSDVMDAVDSAGDIIQVGME